MDSYFGPGVKLVGTLWAKGTVHFEAEFEGEIFASEYFIVGKNGRIFGDIKTYNILNMGKVQGNINAENKVSLADKSSLIGDITTFHLVISEGSNFEGSCKMIDAPPKALKDEAALPEPQPAPEPQKKSEPAKKIQAKTKLVLSCLALVAVGFGFFYPKESVNRQDGFADKAYA
ncbi:MAG: polymer-forming cytoskeletal protein, partial [Nitrospinales bacterium]